MPAPLLSQPPFDLPGSVVRAAGYSKLLLEHEWRLLPHHRYTFVSTGAARRERVEHGITYRLLPARSWPGDTVLDHLLFALRHDGVSLPICRAVCGSEHRTDLAHQLTHAVQKQPTSKYVRRAWFLFESLTGEHLPLPDLKTGNYVPLLDPAVHVTASGSRHPRTRVRLNTLGPLGFSPILRWTPALRSADATTLRSALDAIEADHAAPLLRRAVSYLTTRETLASFEIERERPPRNRAERFNALLNQAHQHEALDEDLLVKLQQAVVDPRFADAGWRHEQNYVGESVGLQWQHVHFVSPQPDDVPDLMAAYLAMTGQLLADETLDPTLVAAVVSFSFVLLHPFTDGNGRLHRWLIHWTLARRGAVPPTWVLPVSAVMLSQRAAYDEALESFSKPLMACIDHTLDDTGRLTVHGKTADLYRHPDLTHMAQALWAWLHQAAQQNLPSQLRFLQGLDRATRGIQAIVDLPDRLLHLFIKVCHANGGTLSRRKRNKHFDSLTDDEVARMEAVVRTHLPPES